MNITKCIKSLIATLVLFWILIWGLGVRIFLDFLDFVCCCSDWNLANISVILCSSCYRAYSACSRNRCCSCSWACSVCSRSRYSASWACCSPSWACYFRDSCICTSCCCIFVWDWVSSATWPFMASYSSCDIALEDDKAAYTDRGLSGRGPCPYVRLLYTPPTASSSSSSSLRSGVSAESD